MRQLREERGLTTDELADLVAVQRRDIEAFETGQAIASPEQVIRLAEAFGVAPSVILGFTPPPPLN